MHTTTHTYTKVEIREVCKHFSADLNMLARRTQAMDPDEVGNYLHDIIEMANEGCLDKVHIQLYDQSWNRIRVHEYTVNSNVVGDSSRPGGNSWPRIPSGCLMVVVSCSDERKLAELERSSKLKIKWESSRLSTDYSDMHTGGTRLYSSGSYGLHRTSYSI